MYSALVYGHWWGNAATIVHHFVIAVNSQNLVITHISPRRHREHGEELAEYRSLAFAVL
jgi:hypothetical protein